MRQKHRNRAANITIGTMYSAPKIGTEDSGPPPPASAGGSAPDCGGMLEFPGQLERPDALAMFAKSTMHWLK